jgi:hypothetical protein
MSATVRKLIYWNGRDLPPGMSSLPVGLYAIESQDEVSNETLAALDEASDALDRGEGTSAESLDRELRQVIATARKTA